MEKLMEPCLNEKSFVFTDEIVRALLVCHSICSENLARFQTHRCH